MQASRASAGRRSVMVFVVLGVVSVAVGICQGWIAAKNVSATVLQQASKTWTLTYKTLHVGDECCSTCSKDDDSGYLNSGVSGDPWQGKRISFTATYRNAAWPADTWIDNAMLDKNGSITNGAAINITDSGPQITIECSESVDIFNNHVVAWTAPLVKELSGRTYNLESGTYSVSTSGTHATLTFERQAGIVPVCTSAAQCTCVDCWQSVDLTDSAVVATSILIDG